MLYTTRPQGANPLHSLVLVDTFLTNPDLPGYDRAREYALNQLLVSIITHEYARQRRVRGLASPVIPPDVNAARSDLALDTRTGAPELMGWSLLFFRYVCVDLNLSLEVLSEAMSVETRTLRRYQTHAVQRLTAQLVEDEWNARREQRRRRLYAELPFPVGLLFVGREDFFRAIRHKFDRQAPRPLYVTGAQGIGKSHAVQKFIQHQIDDNLLDHVLWLDQPPSMAFVREALTERLVPDGSTIGLDEYLSLYAVTLVLDGLEQLLLHPTSLAENLRHIGSAQVFLIHTELVPFAGDYQHVALAELQANDVRMLAQQLTKSNHDAEPIESFAARIWQTAGGNPALVKWLVQNAERVDILPNLVAHLSEAYGRIFNTLPASAQRLWLKSALMPNGEASFEALHALWTEENTVEDAAALQQAHLVEAVDVVSATFTLADGARKYIEQQAVDNMPMKAAIQQLVREMNIPATLAGLDMAEYLLESNWLPITDEVRYRWIRELWMLGVHHDRCARWRLLLETVLRTHPHDFSLRTGYGICLRRLGTWADAEITFLTVIRAAGHEGDFHQQARASLELSILYRYRADFTGSALHLASAEATARRQQDASLLQSIQLEHAQLALEHHEGATALAILNDVPSTLRTLAMRVEAYFLLDDFTNALQLAEQVLLLNRLNPADAARFHSLMGRCYEAQADWEAARNAFGTAMTLLEAQSDLFALARTQANLGAILLKTGSIHEAQLLLTRAEAIQHRLNDRIGLAATRHNLHLARTAFNG